MFVTEEVWEALALRLDLAIGLHKTENKNAGYTVLCRRTKIFHKFVPVSGKHSKLFDRRYSSLVITRRFPSGEVKNFTQFRKNLQTKRLLRENLIDRDSLHCARSIDHVNIDKLRPFYLVTTEAESSSRCAVGIYKK